MDFITTLTSVGMLIAFALPGFILEKAKLLPNGSIDGLISILIYVSIPFLTVESFVLVTYTSEYLVNFLMVAALAVVSCVAVYFVAYFAFRGVKEEKARRACVACSYLSNFGFMGMPMIQSLFPDRVEMLLYCAVFMVVGNLFNWSLTIFIFTGDRKYIGIKKILVNPPVIALVIALPLFFFDVKLPAVMLKGIGYLADLSAPLSMMLVGIRLAKIPSGERLPKPRVLAVTAFKLIVAPLVSFGLMLLMRLFLPIAKDVIVVTFILMSMPTVAVSLSFAEKFDGDTKTVTHCLILTSLCCVLTVPLLTLLTNLI